MASTSISFQDKSMRKFLLGMQKRTAKYAKSDKEYVNIISLKVHEDVTRHFENEKGPDGKWRAFNGRKWSDSYTKFLHKIGRGGNQILQFSGRLRNNFKPADWRTTNEGILWFNDAKTSKGFPYASAHDKGGGKLPKRSFMWLSDKMGKTIEVLTLAYIRDGKK